MTHFNPNTTNIPKAKAKVPYGIECRALWTVEDETRELVGYDGNRLEMCMFAHYLDDPAASELFLAGDPHLNNTRNLGLTDDYRDLTVKNGFYAYLYGAMDPKLGVTLRPDLSGKAAKEYGKFARGVLESGTPGLARLVKQIGDEFSNGGWIETIDGGYVRCPASHAALNYKLQSAGSIVMKQASIFIAQRVKEKGLDAKKVSDNHDEAQTDCARGEGAVFGELACQAIQDAGEELNFRVPIRGDYVVGRTWAETH